MYLFSNEEAYLSIGIARAIFAVPGHFCFGILMGYYYSLAKFYPKTPKKNKALILFAPIVVHGIYDSILFIINVAPAISGVLFIVFLVFCHKMQKYGSQRIKNILIEMMIEITNLIVL
jgi:RsiW-degrading membrane proteinase PrsW (M82 family)